MRIIRLLTAAGLAGALAVPVPATAAAGTVAVDITGARTARGAVAVCTARASDPAAEVDLECSSDLMIWSSEGRGVAAGTVVGLLDRTVCASATARFADGTSASDARCVRF